MPFLKAVVCNSKTGLDAVAERALLVAWTARGRHAYAWTRFGESFLTSPFLERNPSKKGFQEVLKNAFLKTYFGKEPFLSLFNEHIVFLVINTLFREESYLKNPFLGESYAC